MLKLDLQKREEINRHKILVNDYRLRKNLGFSKIYHEHWNKEITGFIPKELSKVVLDCGCGNGILLEFLIANKRFEKTYGIDLSLEMLKELGQKDRTINGDIESLPIKEGSIEVVLSRGALHHAINIERVVREIHRVLIPHGVFVISEPCADSWLLRLPRKHFIHRSDKISRHHKSFFIKELIDIFKVFGFFMKEVKKFGFLAFPLCGLPDFLPIMKYVPFNKFICKYLITFDMMCSRIPIVNHESWGVTMSFEKILDTNSESDG